MQMIAIGRARGGLAAICGNDRARWGADFVVKGSFLHDTAGLAGFVRCVGFCFDADAVLAGATDRFAVRASSGNGLLLDFVEHCHVDAPSPHTIVAEAVAVAVAVAVAEAATVAVAVAVLAVLAKPTSSGNAM